MNTEKVARRAGEYFSDGYNCAQSVAAACLEAGGMDPAPALHGLAPFGAGICYRQEICGAASGGLFAVGMFTHSDDGNILSYDTGKELIRRFEESCGSVNCGVLLGCDITTPGGLAAARESGVFTERCPVLVEKGAALAVLVILENATAS